MNSHYHLIVEVADGVLPTAMQRLNLGYAITFNHRHELRGTTQSHRYGARRINDDAGLVGAFAYVVKNPVRAGACDAPENWPWSSYAGTIGIAPQSSFVDDGRLLRCFELPGVDPRPALRAYVDAA
jgi:putative transposase